jgi:hypothetical protein
MTLKPLASLAFTLCLAACASAPPLAPVEVQTVRIPAPIGCAPAVGAAPAYPDTDAALKAAPDLFSRVRLLVAGRRLRMAREGELSAALSACAGPLAP